MAQAVNQSAPSEARITMGRAANGQGGVASGFDAEVLYPGRGREAMLALYRVSSREWVALGMLSVGQGADLAAVARELAQNPGTFGEELVWRERDAETYERLAEAYDALESLFRAQGSSDG